MKGRRQKASVFLLLVLAHLLAQLSWGYASSSPQAHYPGKSWERVKSPEEVGWSSQKLKEARDYSERTGSGAVMIVYGGRVLDEWGETTRRFRCHSVRKSFMSALYGIYVKEGLIRLSSTLEDLGIDDANPALTPEEKQARVIDLLKARSGVYHPALGEVPAMQTLRPPRGSHRPGTYWYYNNWDFNALGTIFEKATKTSIARAFKGRLAEPLEMEDFRVEDVGYGRGGESVHPSYPFRMSARDMARFGLLYLRQGEWRGRQIIPSSWVEESTKPHSLLPGSGVFGTYGGYGYMWWVAVDGKQFPDVDLKGGTYSAQGYGGHFIVVIPHYDLVVVHRNNTENIGLDGDEEKVSAQFGALLKLIVEAKKS
jgi:CubicO group peptidase (beta-lactamase class C family)